MTAPVFWFLGLSGSGKSTLASAAVHHLESGRATFKDVERWALIDGDVTREFLDRDVGYAFDDRRKSVRITGLLAYELARHGVGVVVANISPFHDLRAFFRERIPGYVEIYCRCPISTCMTRDPKGLYRQQLDAGIKDCIGLDIPFQAPETPDLVIDTARLTRDQSVSVLHEFIARAAGGAGT
jgi:adenylylsulfate kinase-like enzyme